MNEKTTEEILRDLLIRMSKDPEMVKKLVQMKEFVDACVVVAPLLMKES